MHLSSFVGGAVLLLSLASAKPVEKREVGYGDRSEYAADYVANNNPTPVSGSNPFTPSADPNANNNGGGAPPSPNTGPSPLPNGVQSGNDPAVPNPSPITGGNGPAIPNPSPNNPNNSPPIVGPSGIPRPSDTAGTFPGTGAGGRGEVTYPLSNGFPDVKNPSEALSAINKAAQGSLSNAPPPAKAPGPETLTSLQLIAFNELFEVFYFTTLLNKINNNEPGFEFQDQALKTQVLAALTAVQAQEQLHALNANNALRRAGVEPIQPCKYKFPPKDFKEAIATAATFTDIVLGTLADVSVVAGSTGDPNLIRGFTASLGQEGEQNGYYRSLLGKIPSALPFLTASTRQFAFSALNQNFVVPGSCPNAATIKLPIFGGLKLETLNPEPRDQSLDFSVTPFQGQQGNLQGSSIVYINQQLVPIVLPLESLSATTPGGAVNAKAFFPYNQFLMNGLTIAVLVEGSGPFANVSAVAAATKFGPALIQIN